MKCNSHFGECSIYDWFVNTSLACKIPTRHPQSTKTSAKKESAYVFHHAALWRGQWRGEGRESHRAHWRSVVYAKPKHYFMNELSHSLSGNSMVNQYLFFLPAEYGPQANDLSTGFSLKLQLSCLTRPATTFFPLLLQSLAALSLPRLPAPCPAPPAWSRIELAPTAERHF